MKRSAVRLRCAVCGRLTGTTPRANYQDEPRPCDDHPASALITWGMRHEHWPFLALTAFADGLRKAGVGEQAVVERVLGFHADEADRYGWPDLPAADYLVAAELWVAWGRQALPELRLPPGTFDAGRPGLFGAKRTTAAADDVAAYQARVRALKAEKAGLANG